MGKMIFLSKLKNFVSVRSLDCWSYLLLWYWLTWFHVW